MQIPLGIIQENEAETSGMMNILDTYIKYVPAFGSHHIPIPFYGDQLTIERAMTCKFLRLQSLSREAKLTGLLPTHCDWHKDNILLQVFAFLTSCLTEIVFVNICILLQDAFNSLYSSTSSTSVGTLVHTKNYLFHQNSKKDISGSINHCFELARDQLEVYFMGYVMDYYDTEDLNILPSKLAGLSPGEAKAEINRLSASIVEFCWHEVYQDYNGE